MTLREKIVEEIRGKGPIPFSRYMELCLYDPELGYYSRSVEQFGRAGDFYTSSDVHAVFGRLMARQFEEMWRVLGQPERIEVIELGPGRGLFARDVLDWANRKFPEFSAALQYVLIEQSPVLRQRLVSTLADHVDSGKVSIRGHLGIGTSASARVVFANEFFDALPVEVLSSEGELRIAETNGRFVETWETARAEELDFLDAYGVHPAEGERAEVALVGQRVMAEVASQIEQGFVVTIDYGYTRDEQLAGRHRGTVTAYRHHSVSANPYEAPGEQDITAHVNFTALAAAAEKTGMLAQPLLTQSQFLMGIGEANQFADAFEESRLPQERAKVALQLKHLITPAGMGETFHVMVASKGVAAGVPDRLAGLSFGRHQS